MNNAPCYTCTSRSVECHSTCPQYQEYKAKISAAQAEIKKQRHGLSDYIAYKQDIAAKLVARRHLRK